MRPLLPALALLALAAGALLLAGRAGAVPGLEDPARLQAHAPIRIDGDRDFDAAHGVVGGNGTASDPYLIADWRIEAGNEVHVRIGNTTKPFVLRNLYLAGTCVPQNHTADCATEAGIYTVNASAPEIVHVRAEGFDRTAIEVDRSDGAELVENVVLGGGQYAAGTGILVKDSAGVLVRGNFVAGVGPPQSNLASAAVRLWNANFSVVQDNEVRNATEAGVSVLASEGVEVVDNELQGNRVGVTFQGQTGLIWYNNITDSSTYGIVLTQPWARIERNVIANNQRGIEATDAANATVVFNDIEHNAEVGLEFSQQADVNATNDWWGAGDGPGGLGPGSGDKIEAFHADAGQVLFRPFLGARLADAGRHAPRAHADLIVGAPGQGGAAGGAANPRAPRAVFEGPGEAFEFQPVQWSAARSVDPDGGPLRYAWDLGDNTTWAGLRVSHVYNATGEYIVTLTVTDAQGLSSSASVRVTVTRQPLGVFLVLSARQLPRHGELAMRALPSGTPLGNVTFRWAPDGLASLGPPRGNDVLRVRFDEPGDHLVGVVAEAGGESASAFDRVRVVNHPPAANATVEPARGDTRTDFAFSASASSDPDGDGLTYAWDWGDGATGTGANATHRFAAAGTFVVQLTASDGFAANATRLVLNVTQAAPAAARGAPGPEPALGVLGFAAAAACWRRAGRRR